MNENDQARADLLSQQLDALLNGESVTSDDPLLQVAQTLIADAPQPSAAALARFEEQLATWFPPNPAAPPASPSPLLSPRAIVLIVALIILLLLLLILILRQPSPLGAPPIPTATLTLTGTTTATSTTTLTANAAATPTTTATTTVIATVTVAITAAPTDLSTPTLTSATSTPTVVPIARLMVEGRIEALGTTNIVVWAQSYQVRGSLIGLCVGSLVRFPATLEADGQYYVERSAIQIVVNACPPPQGSGGSGNGGSANSGDDDGDDDDDDD